MSEELEQCPLVTPYTNSTGLSPAMLEKLFLLRHWDIEVQGPVPFKWPELLRTNIFDLSRQVDSEPLVLREYQKVMTHHLCRMPRFICGDAVGLGKTLDAIAAACWLKERFDNAKVVVVTTKSTTYQWEEEVMRYSRLRPYVMRDAYRGHTSSDARYSQMMQFLEGKKKDVMIAKYSSMIGTRKEIEGEFDADGLPTMGDKKEHLSEEIRTFSRIFKEHRDNIILVFDECHKFKTMHSSTRNLVFNLSKYAGRVWALTATVIKNGLEEFYNIATGIRIEPVGLIGDFREEFCIYHEQWTGRGGNKKILDGYKNVAHFKKQMRPFFLGRSQKQVGEPLPELTTIYHPIELDARQTQILTDELPNGTIQLPPSIIKVAGEIYEKERDPDNIMTQLSVQQLVTNHWCLLDKTNEKDYHTKTLSPKEEALLDMLDGDYRGEKVIVYTKYKTWIDRLEWLTRNKHFTERKFLRITGNENEKQRNENKKLFQDPNSGYDLIVINAAGMEGINLQQAAHMILLDAPWSWGDLIQLVGRMVRMASPHSACTLHVMVARGTIDEYTIDTLKGKKGVFEKILGESHSAGILDDKDFLDMESGMEHCGTEEEFKELLRAHVKTSSMRSFLIGDLITDAKGNTDYKMSFEKKGSKKHRRTKKDTTKSDEALESRWLM
jgi:SNF2 family DNA or RNA helicase